MFAWHPEGKHAMVKKYMDNGSKNLAWGTEFLEKRSEKVVETSGQQKGSNTKAQILELRGVKIENLEATKADAMLKHFLEKRYK